MARTRTAIVILILILILPIGQSFDIMADDGGRSFDPWFLQTRALERQAIHDMAIGEVDPLSPGLEILVTGGGGIVSQYASDTFEQRSLFTALKTQQAIDIGDIRSISDGNEVVTVGTDHKVHMIYRSNDVWKARTIWESVGSLNGVTIGEFNSSHPGSEIAVTGDEAILAILNEDQNVTGGWAVKVMIVQDIPITNMMIVKAQILSESPGDEILVGSFSGAAFLASHDLLGNWNITQIWRDDYAILGFGTGVDLVPNITAPEIYMASFGGKVTLVHYNGTNWTHEPIYQDPDELAIYSVVPADVDPRYPGAELVVSGMSQNAHIIRYDNGTWIAETIKDKGGNRLKLLYDVEVGEIDSHHPGLEVLMGGILQDLLEIAYYEPGFELSPMPSTQTAISGHNANFWVSVEALGNFYEEVTLSSTDNVQFSKVKVMPGDQVHLIVPTTAMVSDMIRDIVIEGRSTSGYEANTTLKLDLRSEKTRGFELKLYPEIQNTIPGFSATYLVEVTLINEWGPQIEFSVKDPGDLKIDIDYDSSGFEVPAVITVTPTSFAASATHFLEIKAIGTVDSGGSAPFTYGTSVIATLDVDARGLPDFTLSVSPIHRTGVWGSTVWFDVSLNPMYEFDEDVVLSVDGIPEGSVGSFSSKVMTLPTQVSYRIDLGPVKNRDVPIITFTATGGGMVHTSVVSVHHLNPDEDLDFRLSVIPEIQVGSPGARISYLVEVEWFGTVNELTVDPGDAPFYGTISAGLDGNPMYRTMTIDIYEDATPGRYETQVIGIGDWEHNVSFEVVVDPSNDIALNFDRKEIMCVQGTVYCEDGGPKILAAQTWDTDMGTLIGSYEGIPSGTPEGYEDWTREYYHLSIGGKNTSISVPVPEAFLKDYLPGRYLLAFVFEVEGKEYPKALIMVINLTKARPIISLSGLRTTGGSTEGSIMDLEASVINLGSKDADHVSVEFFVDSKSVGQKGIETLSADREEQVAKLHWVAIGGSHNITALITQDTPGENALILDGGSGTIGLAVKKMSFTGPAIAIVLIIIMMGLVLAMKADIKRRGR